MKTNEDKKENSSDSKNIHIPSFPDYCRPVSGLVLDFSLCIAGTVLFADNPAELESAMRLLTD